MATLNLLAGTVTDVQLACKLQAISQSQEAFVNGFWNSVLNNWFPSTNLDWSINPEQYTGIGNDRMDFLVYKNKFDSDDVSGKTTLTSTPRILYEGKQVKGDTLKKCGEQIDGYFKSQATFPKGTGANTIHYFAIGTRGTKVAFWMLEVKDNGHRVLYTMAYKVDNNGKVSIATDQVMPGATDVPTYDLTSDDDMKIIIYFLDFLRTQH